MTKKIQQQILTNPIRQFLIQLISQLVQFLLVILQKSLVEQFHTNFNKKSIVINNSVPLDIFSSTGKNFRNKLNFKEEILL